VRQQDTSQTYGVGTYNTVASFFKGRWHLRRWYSRLSSQNMGPKFEILVLPWGTAPKMGEDLSGTNMYHFVQNSTPIGATVAAQDICNQSL